MNRRYRVDLIAIGEGQSPEWNWGTCRSITGTVQSLLDAVQQLQPDPQEYVLFLSNGVAIDESALAKAMENGSPLQVSYDPELLKYPRVPRLLEFISPGSYFNLPTSPTGYSIWDMSWHCLLVKKEVLNTVGFLDQGFQSPEGALMDWIQRMIFQGVLFQRQKLAWQVRTQVNPPMPVADEWRMVNNRLGRQWVRWCALRYVLGGFVSPGVALSTYRKVKAAKMPSSSKIDHTKWRDTTLPNNNPRISIIIPTVERYSYVVTVLSQLKTQTILPLDVMVIDQTPKELRKPELFQGYEEIGLRYFTMEESGQCRSRNLGLMECRGDYILFIDDDVEIKPDLLESHLRCMHYFDADVSCGVCDEVDAGPTPKDYTFIRQSDVFPTNNGMIRRTALERSGLFDMAFDHGQRADGDLGARVYKAGARLILNPEIRVLHHRAPRGGLRKHNVRKMTYSSSRKYITHFRIPHVTELYLNKIHFTTREQREYIILSVLGLFSIRGNRWKKVAKIGYALVRLPAILVELYKRNKKSVGMLKQYPLIPRLKK